MPARRPEVPAAVPALRSYPVLFRLHTVLLHFSYKNLLPVRIPVLYLPGFWNHHTDYVYKIRLHRRFRRHLWHSQNFRVRTVWSGNRSLTAGYCSHFSKAPYPLSLPPGIMQYVLCLLLHICLLPGEDLADTWLLSIFSSQTSFPAVPPHSPADRPACYFLRRNHRPLLLFYSKNKRFSR